MHVLAVERSWMREIGLEHHVVRPDVIDQASRSDLLEPIAGVDVAREVLGWQQVKFGTLLAHAVALKLVVHRLEHKGNPPDATLDRNELDRRIAIQHP